jgi:hypothetical protein
MGGVTHRPETHGSNHTGAIVGSIVGGVGAVILGLLVFFLWRRRSRRKGVQSMRTEHRFDLLERRTPSDDPPPDEAIPRPAYLLSTSPAPAGAAKGSGKVVRGTTSALPASENPTAPPSPTTEAHVDNILEMIARRIDPPDASHPTPSESPPTYRW